MSITQNGSLKKDDNDNPVMGGTSSSDNATIINSSFDPVTRRLLTDSASGAGSVTSVSVVSSNGFAGTVATATTTPAITLSTTVTGILKGNGTAISAATAGTDYVTASSTNTFTNKTYDTAGAGNAFAINGTSISAVQGTGAVVLATSPTITTPTISGHFTAEGVTTTGATGTGNLVFATSPTLSTAVLGSSTATTQTPSDNSTKVATTAYVDAAVLGQNFKEAAKYATTGALVAVVYANGASGVGATLTEVGFGAIGVDGASPIVGDRILVKNQASTFQNGIYTVTIVGTGAAVFVLTRSTDTNQTSEFKTGDSVFVTNGTANSTTTWAYTGIDSPTMGTDAITYAQVAGQGSFTAGNGIAITGNSIAIDTSVTVDKTTSQTLTNKTLTSPILTTPTLGVATATSINKMAITAPATSSTLAVADGKTFTVNNTMTLAAGADSQTFTFPAATATVAGLGTTQTFTGQDKFNNIIDVNNAVTVTSNAGTVPVTFRLNTFTNSSASAMTITMTTASAVDGQMTIVRIYDASGVTKAITWVNTENSTVTAPTTSNGSTTLPLTVGFMYNSATSLWRCIASA